MKSLSPLWLMLYFVAFCFALFMPVSAEEKTGEEPGKVLDKEPGVFTSLQEALKNPELVKKLDLKEKGLPEIPPEIEKLAHLEYLDLSYNTFSKLPPEIGKLANLKTLLLRCTRLAKLPPEMAQLSKLEVFEFGGSMDWDFEVKISPEDLELLGKLTALKELRLDFMPDLKRFPKEICGLKNLEKVSLSYCSAVGVPLEIGNLGALKELDLVVNEIPELPPTIGKLANLELLDLSQNRLKDLPSEISGLKNLKSLKLGNDYDEGNKFSPDLQEKIRKWFPKAELEF